MSVVLDRCATLAWVYGDELTPAVDALFDLIAESGAFVSRLWYLEAANSLSVAVWRSRMSPTKRADPMKDIAQRDITVDDDKERHTWQAGTQPADLYRLSACDAAYLEYAQRRRSPL